MGFTSSSKDGKVQPPPLSKKSGRSGSGSRGTGQRSARGRRKLFSFCSPIAAGDEYVGHEIARELTMRCTSLYSEGADLVALLNSGEVRRVPRNGDFLKPYRDMLALLKEEETGDGV